MKKFMYSFSLLLLATSAFAVGNSDVSENNNNSSTKTIRSALKDLTPQQVKIIANLPLSTKHSYQHWARPDLVKEIGTQKFELFLQYEDPFYKDTDLFKMLNIRPIMNNPGDNNPYGRSFHSFTGIEIPYLLDCFSPQGSTPKNVIEIASAEGKVVWKAAMAGANVTANDLSLQELKILDGMVKNRVPTRLTDITTIPGSCFDILIKQPTLRGTYDVLFSKNLIHFFNDTQLLRFAELTRDLIKERGRAYITANTYRTLQTPTYTQIPVIELFHETQDNGADFPGYQIVTITEICIDGESKTQIVLKTTPAHSNQSMERKYLARNELSPEERNELTKTNPELALHILEAFKKGQKIERVTYEQPSMFFDTSALTKIFEKVDLKTLEAFYLDADGKRQESHDTNTAFVSAIFEKPTQTSSLSTVEVTSSNPTQKK